MCQKPASQQVMQSEMTASYRQGLEWPTPRFTDNGDGTVTDTLTGLMWLKDGGCFKKNWSSALEDYHRISIIIPANIPAVSILSDYSDWRLPNIREIESLVNYGVSNSAGWINLNGFTNLNSSSYWSSTTYSGCNIPGMGSRHEGRNLKIFRQNLHSLRLACAHREYDRNKQNKGTNCCSDCLHSCRSGKLIPLSLRLVKQTSLSISDIRPLYCSGKYLLSFLISSFIRRMCPLPRPLTSHPN